MCKGIKTKFPLEEIIERYQNSNLSLRDLARLYNTNHCSLSYLLKRAGIPIKDKGEMISEAWKKQPHPRLGKKGAECPVYGRRHSDETKKKMRDNMLGDKSPAWINGRTRHPLGYVLVTIDGSQLLEHRVLMEKHLGRKLSPDEVVHHINGNRTDNRIENLTVMSRAEHMIHHKIGRK